MDVIELLKKDHDEVSQLFQRFKGGGGLTGIVKRVTGSVTPAEQRRIALRICDELDVHAQVEEEIFYPAVRMLRDSRLDGLLDESEHEHQRIKELVAQTRMDAADSELLQERATALEECVTHHVNEEEGEMFPRLEEVMPDDERERIGAEVKARKTALKRESRHVPARSRARRAPARRAAAKSKTVRHQGKPRAAKRAKVAGRKRAKKRGTRGR
jgi:hemerythrin superfamily protein